MTSKRTTKDKTGKPMYRVKEIAQAMGISLKAGYRLIERMKKGDEALRVRQFAGKGGAVLIERSEIERCLGPDVIEKLEGSNQ